MDSKLKNMKHIKIAIICLTLLILFAAFFGNVNYLIENPFLAYLYYVLNLFVRFLPIIIIIFSIILGILIWKYYSKKHDSKKTLHSFFQIFEVLIISMFSAFIILLLIAIIQLNVFSAILNNDPAKLGVKTDIKQIILSLKENNQSPIIISSDQDSRDGIVAISKAASGNNFYGNIILSGIPRLLIYPIKNDLPNIMLIDNSLIITKADIKDIEIISPVVSNLFLKKYFPQRQIKAYPKVSVMNDNEYNNFRKKDVQDKITKINQQVDSLDDSISSTSASIELINIELEAIEISKEEALIEKDKRFNDCLNEGDYIDGEFVRDNTKRECQEIVDELENDFIEQEESEKNLLIELEVADKKLAEYEYLNTFFQAQQKLTDISVNNIPSERGLFIPEDKIQIVLLDEESNSISNYFASLVHEYLHYASYTPGRRLESSFFEEGLTEYFAREAIKGSMQIDTNIGYPLTVEIIKQILRRVPEQDMADVYFTKDQEKLESILDLVYGENFYRNTIVQFETLQYTGDEDEAIKSANEILEKIDGVELNKEDVFSN